MECRSKPPDDPQYYTDPATGQKTDCWWVCGTNKVADLCDYYCKGYCTDDASDTTPTTSTLPTINTASSAVVTTITTTTSAVTTGVTVLIVIVVLLVLILLCLLLMFLIRRACPGKIHCNLPCNDGNEGLENGRDNEMKNVKGGQNKNKQNGYSQTFTEIKENGVSNGQRQNRKPVSGEKVGEERNGGKVNADPKGEASQTVKNSDNQARFKKPLGPEHGNQHTTSVDTCDTGVGSMSQSCRAVDESIRQTDVINTGNEHTGEGCVSYRRSESGNAVGNPSHSYTEKNNIVTTPTEETRSMLASQEYQNRSTPCDNRSINRSDCTGMDKDLAEDFRQSLLHNPT